MFTQPCFIRKNTPELRKKLRKLGYANETIRSHSGTSLSLYDNAYWNHGSADMVVTDGSYGIDCGTNEDLFLALAALRDDSDEYQWFTDGNGWLKCQYEYIEDEVQEARECHYFGATVYNCHKATVEELVEHFKDR